MSESEKPVAFKRHPVITCDPCPFCDHGTGQASIRTSGSFRDASVVCDACEAELSSPNAWLHQSEDEENLTLTIAAWNRRAPLPSDQVASLQREALERAAEAFDIAAAKWHIGAIVASCIKQDILAIRSLIGGTHEA